MNYLDALKHTHQALAPKFYIEIGCRKGNSLTLANCPSVGIDPDPEITCALPQPVQLFRETSDDFFCRRDLGEIIRQAPDLAFIDGMHLVEFALRDFMNLEGHCAPHSVIIIDDVVPGDMAWASRTRETKAWTGDVYRLIPVLRKYRPDLEIAVFDANIAHFSKGIAVISKLDPENGILHDAYDKIMADLEAGLCLENTVDTLRTTLRVRTSDGFRPYIEDLAKSLTRPVAHRSQLAGTYLDTLKKSLLNVFYREDEFRILYLRQCLAGETTFDMASFLDPREADPETYALFESHHDEGRPFLNTIANLGFPKTMMGRARLDNLHDCLDYITDNNIPGDLIECGVWRGGGCILMAGYLHAFNLRDRQLIIADSFEGLPVPSHQKDEGLDLSKEIYPQLAVSLETVRSNFSDYGLLDDSRQHFLKGWFSDTLTTAPTNRIALLRMDGDLYESTMDILTALYDRVAPGGIVIVDDYGILRVCREAIADFFAARGEPVPEMTKIDWTGTFFTKPH